VEFVLTLVVLLVVLAGLVTTALVLATRRAVRAVQGSRAVRHGRELTQLAGTAVAVVRSPARADRGTAALAARVTTASMTLQREVDAARRAGVHLGEVPDVLPQLVGEGTALSRALRAEVTAPSAQGPRLADAARAHLAAVGEVTAAVRASAALPPAHGSVAAEASRVAAGLQCWSDAYLEIVERDRTA